MGLGKELEDCDDGYKVSDQMEPMLARCHIGALVLLDYILYLYIITYFRINITNIDES